MTSAISNVTKTAHTTPVTPPPKQVQNKAPQSNTQNTNKVTTPVPPTATSGNVGTKVNTTA
ncbi:hypothetical protein [Solimicrobium silvestre]|uniref:Uncharacterized protein n=1 Tax=Solimicrobium silvestre TaxID=2099400 RepID=A0A2S9H3J5_9BURK|nr:hypothetical protein [Solimicrobium silvestre]PRC94537.1 hypothetical protein S2091_0540 [Solimicrobium silvestre]